MTHLLSPKRLLAVSLVLGWSVDGLFYGKQLGVSLLLLAIVVTAALFVLGRLEGVRPRLPNLWLLLPLFFFASMVFIRANPFVTTLNVLAVLLLFAYLAFFYAAGRVPDLSIAGHFLLPLRVGGHSLVRAAPLVAVSVDGKAAQARGRRSLFPVLRGILLAAPVLLVFTILLASADPIFADTVERLLNLELLPDLTEWLWRGLLIVAAGWLIAGGLVYAFGRPAASPEPGELEKAIGNLGRAFSIGFVEAATVLSLVNLLFLSFVTIQFTYLFGGQTNIRLDGYTYAEYARRGFFELVAVAALTLALILTLNWLTRRPSPQHVYGFNGLGSVMVGLVLVILASAFQRLRLYEATYGYTELRLYVYVFMGWLALTLAWFLVTLWWRPGLFAIGLMAAAMGFLATLDGINPDAFIVQQNLARYQSTGDLDVLYLTSLSDDAVPGLVAALSQTQGDDELLPDPTCQRDGDGPPAGDDCLTTRSAILEEELSGRRRAMEEDSSWRRWQSFHLARWSAYQILADGD